MAERERRETDFFLLDRDRYAGLRLIRWWDQDLLARSHVMVVGCGALGNEVLKNLVLLGLGRITVVDFDRIEDANLVKSVFFRPGDLGRSKVETAVERCSELNADAHVKGIHGDVTRDVGLGLFLHADVVVSCLDNREARLFVNQSCWKVNTPWVDGAIQEISGTVRVYTPPHGSCYECTFTDEDYRHLNLRYSCPGLRSEDLARGKVPTTPTVSSIVAGLEAQETVKLLHGVKSMASKALVFNGLSTFFYVTDLPRREDCLSHETYGDILALPMQAADTTVADLLAEAAPGREDAVLLLDRDLVTSLICPGCGNEEEENRLREELTTDRLPCPDCGRERHPVYLRQVDSAHALAGNPLADLGVPPFDVVQVGTPDRVIPVLLDGDRAAMLPPA